LLDQINEFKHNTYVVRVGRTAFDGGGDGGGSRGHGLHGPPRDGVRERSNRGHRKGNWEKRAQDTSAKANTLKMRAKTFLCIKLSTTGKRYIYKKQTFTQNTLLMKSLR